MIEEGLLDGGAAPDGGLRAARDASAHGRRHLGAPGPAMASGDTIQIVVRGRGGHASAPHDCLDPIPIACEIVQAFQTLVTRRVHVFDPAVLTIAKIEAGTTRNVIPDTASLLGTIRTVSEATRERVLEGVRRVAEGVASAHGAEVGVEADSRLSGHGERRRLRRLRPRHRARADRPGRRAHREPPDRWRARTSRTCSSAFRAPS